MKEINNYPHYKVGEDGTVISYKFSKQKVLKAQLVTQSKKKYLAVGLYNENNKRTKYGKTPTMQYLHRLVWEAYIGEIPSHLEIEHIDQDPHNCHISNLKLVSREENIHNHFKNKNGYVYADTRDQMIEDYLDLKTFQRVADKWQCNVGTVYRVIKNKKAKVIDGKYTLIDAGTCDDFFTQKDLRITGTRKDIGMGPAHTYKKKKS